MLHLIGNTPTTPPSVVYKALEEIALGRQPGEQSNKAKLGHLFGFVTHTGEVRAVEIEEGGLDKSGKQW